MDTPSNYNKTVSPALIDRLYRRAEALERDWMNAGLASDFGTLMIVAVVRHLERVGYFRPDGTRRTETEQVAFALNLLRRFWVVNARRDAARRTARIKDGRQVETVCLDDIGEGATTVSFDTQLGAYHDACDPFDGDSGRNASAILQEHGWTRERAWAFVLYQIYEEDYEMVRYVMARRFDADLTPERLRTWKCRFWEKGYEILKKNRKSFATNAMQSGIPSLETTLERRCIMGG